MKTRILAGAWLVFGAMLGSAQDYYVDAVNGDDANGGSAWDDAWRTIHHAADSTGWDATIYIAPGTYEAGTGERFPIQHSARTFVGVAGSTETIVDGGGAARIFEANEWDGGARIEGLTLRNAGTGVWTRVSGWLSEIDATLTLRDVRIEAMSSSGVNAHCDTDWSDAWLHLIVERSRIEGCGIGIRLDCFGLANHPTTPPTAYGRLTCTDSLLIGNDQAIVGSETGDSDDNRIAVERCTIAGNVGDGIRAWLPGVSGQVRNSIVYGNGEDVAGDIELSWSCTTSGPFPGTGNVAGDPLFNDPASSDWRPRFGSPCIDAAEPGAAPMDLVGLPRSQDGDLDLDHRADMGTFELAPLTPRGEARIGTTVELELWGPPGGMTTVMATLASAGSRRWTNYGWLLLAPPLRNLGSHTVGSGPPAVFELRIPNDVGLIGQTVSVQALTSSVDAPGGFAWTNAVELTVMP